MLFVTLPYFVFLYVVLTLFYVTGQRYRRYILLLASYYFYARWNLRFVPLLLGLTVIDFAAGLWIHANRNRRRRAAALWISLAANLGFLAVFKYYNFAASNIAWLLNRPSDSFFVEIVLPLGISFHTFQSISYVIDVYRGTREPERDFIDYALFISFFPQLVAGPIVRAGTFFADLRGWRPPSFGEVKTAALLLALGLVKKLVLADSLAVVSDRYFGAVASHPGMLEAWGGAAAFSFQLFFDFSGYSDMAIGSALLFGFRFPVNFRQPFLAISVTDFWRRWHMTLSNWLRDYLYIPLGGNRGRGARPYLNLILTMSLAGLWHGARWGFVIWGALNGVLLALERVSKQNKIRDRSVRTTDLPRILLTFVLFCAGIVFFRAATVHDAMLVLGSAFSGKLGAWPIDAFSMLLIASSAGLALLADRGAIDAWFERCSFAAAAVSLGILLVLVEVFGQHQSRPFYYFQF